MSPAEAIPTYPVVKLPVRQLRPSEKINVPRARTLIKLIVEAGQWTTPILVEHRHSIIMDGHHRYFCAMELELSFVPCILLSYDDPNLNVTYWGNPAPAVVDHIIQAGLSGNLMSFKTTRHRLNVTLPSCAVALDELK
ncbi:ParB N-terminal domain-containing protein [Paraburkholderia sprentiae WSM5005]|uniref:ParB N-terminal domain-containing protein n=1 Tax=Paraburkholderia sprentiae WSM5005 TaxID=754502 RepID=A0A8F4KHM2_9BURK|nr:ParB N-terminal domain-containing protein [Paraburkholderia sprentiae]QXE07238.1 ParB N-terminal domain-containing protein [Paraburkholderia sprentiae WSM5005]